MVVSILQSGKSIDSQAFGIRADKRLSISWNILCSYKEILSALGFLHYWEAFAFLSMFGLHLERKLIRITNLLLPWKPR